jgi:hypothetical protein
MSPPAVDSDIHVWKSGCEDLQRNPEIEVNSTSKGNQLPRTSLTQPSFGWTVYDPSLTNDGVAT